MGGIAYDKGYGTDGKDVFNLRDTCIDMMKDLEASIQPKEILEFGTQGGCSACLFLALTKANLTSIDLCNGTGNVEWDFSYIDYGVLDDRPGMKEIIRVLNILFPSRFRFIAGSSYGEETINKYNDRNYDLLFVDGDHSFEGCRADCQTAVRLNIPWVLVDDYTSSEVIRSACGIPELEIFKIYENIHNFANIGIALFRNKNYVSR
jgi:hypothetical protein